jgi:hypothetical protein
MMTRRAQRLGWELGGDEESSEDEESANDIEDEYEDEADEEGQELLWRLPHTTIPSIFQQGKRNRWPPIILISPSDPKTSRVHLTALQYP